MLIIARIRLPRVVGWPKGNSSRSLYPPTQALLPIQGRRPAAAASTARRLQSTPLRPLDVNRRSDRPASVTKILRFTQELGVITPRFRADV